MVANALGTVRNLRISYEGKEDIRSADDYIAAANAVSVDQLWFWTEEWQAGEREVDEYIRAGNFEEFDSLDDMFLSLNNEQ